MSPSTRPTLDEDALHDRGRYALLVQRSHAGRQVEHGSHIYGQVDVRSGQTIGSFVHSQIVSIIRYQSLTEINDATLWPCSEKLNAYATTASDCRIATLARHQQLRAICASTALEQ